MYLIFSLIVILFSAIIHEYMHGWAADKLGDPTAERAGRLTLNPIAHIDPWGSIVIPALLYFGTGGGLIFGYAKPVPFNPYNLRDQKYGSAKVAIAGPLSNFAIALFFGLLLRFFAGSAINENLSALLSIIVQINLILMIFNLIPIPPLDGSRVLRAFLPYDWQLKLDGLERYGMILVFAFILFGFSLIIPIFNFLFKLIVG